MWHSWIELELVSTCVRFWKTKSTISSQVKFYLHLSKCLLVIPMLQYNETTVLSHSACRFQVVASCFSRTFSLQHVSFSCACTAERKTELGLLVVEIDFDFRR